MKKLSFKLLLPLFFLSILLSEFISTSINPAQDGLQALLNLLLPVIWGAISVLFIIATYFAVKEVPFRKTIIILFAFLNLGFGTVLKVRYSLLENGITHNIPKYNNSVDQYYHLTSSNPGKVNNEGIKVEIPEKYLSDDQLFFSKISSKGHQILSQKPDVKLDVKDHDKVTVRIENNGNKNLIISKAAFHKHGLWKISSINNVEADDSAFPIVISANNFSNITVQFTAETFEKRIKRFGWNALLKMQWNSLRYAKQLDYQSDIFSSNIIVRDELTFYSDNKLFQKLYLNGLWQYRAEGEWEPDLQKILVNLSFKTNIGFKYSDNGAKGEAIIANSDEVEASYFVKASDTIGVKITQLAAYHAFKSLKEDDALKFFYKDDKLSIKLFNNEPGAAQSLLPKMINNEEEFISFNPQKAFGFIMGTSNTDRAKNYKNKIGIRVWKAINLKGEIVPNSYILGCDFIGQARTNYDYQDNVYLIQNVKLFGYEQTRLTSIPKKML